MKFKSSRKDTVFLVSAGMMLIVMSAAPRGQRGRGGADPNQGAPAATNAILQNPDAYYGKRVTISAGVEQVLSKTAFVIDQRKAVGVGGVTGIGKPILVIAPYLTGALDERHYLLMTGQIVKFDPAAIAGVPADYKLDLAPEVGAKYLGQPVLVATSVRTSTYVEVGKKPVPPPSAAELSLDAAMKTIAPAFAELRTAIQESKTDVVSGNAVKLKPMFTQAETIWNTLGQSPAAAWAREAQAHTAAIETAAAGGDWAAAKASATALNQVCQNCHAAYRERQEDGTFRIKSQRP
ncbi:MAG TPA: hypothetical protein VGZ27_06265 [Vicinamibacterales bacterium]|jgi:hypothetical protein|nr:hypothetical protein [Vicinamibacterales bacterium]